MIIAKRWVYLVAIICVAALSSYGCSVHARQVPVSVAVRQIGLPLYPHAQPLHGQELTTSIKIGAVDEQKITLWTHDDPSRVQEFYVHRIPKDARKTTVAL